MCKGWRGSGSQVLCTVGEAGGWQGRSQQSCQVLCTVRMLFTFTVEQGVKWTEAEFMSECLKLVKLVVEQGDSGPSSGLFRPLAGVKEVSQLSG